MPNEIEWSCGDCGQSYKTQNALTAHRRIHKKLASPEGIQKFPAHKAPERTALPDSSEVRHDVVTPMMWDSGIRSKPQPTVPVTVKVKKLPHGKHLPDLQKATPGSAAVDLYAAIDRILWIGAQDRAIPPVPTGLSIELPPGYVAKVVPRSGLAVKHGLGLTNSVGIIDSDYRGEIMVTLVNHGHAKVSINPGDRIAQMLIEKVEPVQFEYVDELSDTERGTGGFGSTGVTTVIHPGNTINFTETAAVRKVEGNTVRKLPPDHNLIKNITEQ